ncbi:MAG: ABC1 kinase family protein [Pseudobdellovibrionaceae bacterium]
MAIKKSIFLRSLELAKMTLKLGLKEVQSGDLQSRLEQARIITQSLSQLKGAAMKAGQLISIEMADYFPPEAAEILAQLQNNATALPFEVIKKILEKELGPEKFKQFTWINEKPQASASIAQIHRAKWQHQELALKIQHPGIAESIDSDLAIIERMTLAFCKLTQRSMDLKPVFAEIKNVLKQEVDFIKEAELIQSYSEKLLTLKSKKDYYFCPTVVNSLSTKKLLTMSWENGENLSQWMRQSPSMRHREQVAHLILNLYCHEFFEWGLVQTDPNFSNFLIRDLDKEVGLVLLDFGSTRHYERSLINQYVELLKAVQRGKEQDIIQNAVDFGLIDKRESEETKQLFIAMMDVAVEPFAINEVSLNSSEQVFDFASSDYTKRSQAAIRNFAKNLKYSAPPHRILFLHRKLGGIFSLLKRLEVKINISSYWEMMVENRD